MDLLLVGGGGGGPPSIICWWGGMMSVGQERRAAERAAPSQNYNLSILLGTTCTLSYYTITHSLLQLYSLYSTILLTTTLFYSIICHLCYSMDNYC